MKIVAVETFILRHPLAEPFGYSQMWYDTRAAMLVRVTTDTGAMGWGEAFGPPEPSAAIIDALFAPMLLGADPTDTAPLWERMYVRTRDYGQKGFAIHAISAVDIALWDLKGKMLGVSVSRLLGGRFRDRVQAYATGLYFRPKEDFIADLVAEARSHVAAGFRAIKMKVGYTPEADIRHTRAVREAIGPEVQLMVDANHAYDAATAIRLGREFDRAGPVAVGVALSSRGRRNRNRASAWGRATSWSSCAGTRWSLLAGSGIGFSTTNSRRRRRSATVSPTPTLFENA